MGEVAIKIFGSVDDGYYSQLRDKDTGKVLHETEVCPDPDSAADAMEARLKRGGCLSCGFPQEGREVSNDG